MIITKIKRDDIKYHPSLKGCGGLYAVINKGCYYIAGKTKKDAENLKNILNK